jgi:putative ATP-binding cassette transporter
MKKKPVFHWRVIFLWVLLQFILVVGLPLEANTGKGSPSFGELKRKIGELIKEGNIPGLSLLIVKDNEPVIIESFGYADLEKKIPVTAETLFQLASCSKAFTSLAALQLEEKGLINLDDPVSKYIPGFFARYKQRQYEISIRQLLHHTSGVPWKSVDLIPVDNSPDALQKTARQLVGIQLDAPPGEHFQYATINYDVVGAIIEIVTRQSYEDYMKHYVFTPLGLNDTFIGVDTDSKNPLMAKGYKIGFWKPRLFEPPVYRGNNPAAYIISNAKDIARWLRIQLELEQTDLNHLVQRTHLRDETVPPQEGTITSYAMGWNVSLRGDQQITHSGGNPNFTTHFSFFPRKKIAVAVLVNSNGGFADSVGNYVVNYLTRGELLQLTLTKDKTDTVCSIITIVAGIYLLLNSILLCFTIFGFFKGRNTFEGFTWKKLGKFIGVILMCIPYLLGIYFLPKAVTGVSWATVFVWGPISIYLAVLFLGIAFAFSFSRFLISLLLPNRNRYLNFIPMVVLLGIMTGLSNTAILFLITTSFYSPVSLGYLLYYFLITFLLYTMGTKIVASKMINITNNITLDLRTDLINKIMAAKYQNFEKLEPGRIFTTLNDDTSVLAGSAQMMIGGVTSFVTAFSAFVYLTSISLKATVVVFIVVIVMTAYYYIISKISRRFLEQARDAQNVYMQLLNDLIRGFKDLSIHLLKKKEYRQDLLDTCLRFCQTNITAAMKFLNSNIIGNSFIMIILGTLSIVVPRVLTGVRTITLISYIMVLLYLIGPINGLLNLIPGVTRLKVSWDRIKKFKQILDQKVEPDSANELIKKLNAPKSENRFEVDMGDQVDGKLVVHNLKLEGVKFQYKEQDDENNNEKKNEDEKEKDKVQPFSVGPIDLEINKGEILFIIGGNGSGKTTLAKLMAGLYVPDEGTVKINGKPVTDTQLGEYFSTLHSDFHVFDKLYEIDVQEKETEIENYLKLFDLDKKVKVKGNEYTTVRLSMGQRKRLALMQGLLEDRPILLFDEFAANQDPEFRRYFYRKMCQDLKKRGKIIIAATHDDHYFDVADKIVKLDMGKLDSVGTNYRTTT